jgi:NADH-quinone oxidoreductase subunit H
MGGWASNNKYSLMGALRSAAQAVSYEIPLVLSIITICLLSGTLDVVKISQMQAGGLLNWNIFGGGALIGVTSWLQALVTGAPDAASYLSVYFSSPIVLPAVLVLIVCTVVSLAIYLTAACAEINRIPFDLPEAESELVSGYNTEYSGIKFAIFFLAEFTNLFVVSTIATVMFFGCGDCPLPDWLNPFLNPAVVNLMNSLGSFLLNDLHLAQLHFDQFIEPKTFFASIWVIIKVYGLVFFAILVRGTLPRFRIDQLMAFGWKRLVPLSLLVFILVTFARGAVHLHV